MDTSPLPAPFARRRTSLASSADALHGLASGRDVRLVIYDEPLEYTAAIEAMEAQVSDIAAGNAPETVWFLEHPPVYTAGTSANEDDLREPHRFPVFQTGRGGQYTYHGPGQRVAYVMLNVAERGRDVRLFVAGLEAWLIRTLGTFNIRGERREDRVGVWVEQPEKGPGVEDKIAAIGIRMRKWISFHGISLNVEPDLSHFDGIVPCGVTQHGVTSLVDLGHPVTMADADLALKASFAETFGDRLVQD